MFFHILLFISSYFQLQNLPAGSGQGAKNGRFDKYEQISRMGIVVAGRRYISRKDTSGRMFTLLITGKPEESIFLDEFPESMGYMEIIPEMGPLTRVNFIFTRPDTEVTERLNGPELSLEFGVIRKEQRLKNYIRDSLKRPMVEIPELKMKPYPEIRQLIEIGSYEEALSTLQALSIGHGNGLRDLLLGDVNLILGRIATAKRSYSGVIKRFGNFYFSALSKARLYAITMLLENFKPETGTIEAQLSALKPQNVQDMARIEFAITMQMNEKAKDALRLLIPVTDPVATLYRQNLATRTVRLNHAARKYAPLSLFCSHNEGLLKLHPQRREMILKCSHSFYEMEQFSKAVSLLQEEIRTHGNWRKNDVHAEKLYYMLTKAFFAAGNLFKSEATARFYLENKGNDAPREWEVWEIFAKILLGKNRVTAAATALSTALSRIWWKSRVDDLSHRYVEIIEKTSNPDAMETLLKTILDLINVGKKLEKTILRAVKLLDKSDRIEKSVEFMEKVKNPGSYFLVELSRKYQLMGDTINNILTLEEAMLAGGKWGGVAERELKLMQHQSAVDKKKMNEVKKIINTGNQ
ncbi:hypothetical protein KKF34_05015 [Myxococcota bacterium]|nr:hypothetical protein [Myxococcota bacterium]MBU1379208.1 hypothetical protein [Myxococcota bacterium]MBU1496221.1 hypothetical protein [Myxococcota bacterium]